MIDKKIEYEELDKQLTELIAWWNSERGTTHNLLRITLIQKKIVLKAYDIYMEDIKTGASDKVNR